MGGAYRIAIFPLMATALLALGCGVPISSEYVAATSTAQAVQQRQHQACRMQRRCDRQRDDGGGMQDDRGSAAQTQQCPLAPTTGRENPQPPMPAIQRLLGRLLESEGGMRAKIMRYTRVHEGA